MPAIIALSLLTLLTLAAPVPATANPTISCHCFQDRSYNPNQPDAIDPYLLATTQNSLIAAFYQVPKRDLVRRKMTGTPNDEIWVTHHRNKTGRQVDGANQQEAARLIVDQVVIESLGLTAAEVTELRSRGADNAELILAAYLSHKGEPAPLEIYTQVAEKRASWGQTFSQLGAVIGQIEDEIRELVGKNQ